MMKHIVSKAHKLVKDRQSDILLGITVALLVLLAFGLGFLYSKQQFKEPLRIQIHEDW